MSIYSRRAHWLKRMATSGIPRNIVAVDTLSRPVRDSVRGLQVAHELDVCVASYCRVEKGAMHRVQTITCQSSETFWQWLYKFLRNKQSVWVIGERVSEHFTLLRGWGKIESGELSLEQPKHATGTNVGDERCTNSDPRSILVDSDPPFLLIAYRGRSAIHIVDTRNYGRISTEQIAADVGSRLHVRPDEFSGDREREAYLHRRVAAVRDWFGSNVIAWNESGLGQWRHTASGLAWSAYRAKYLTRGVLVHNCEEGLTLERQALAGGYTRVFLSGHVSGPVYVYDVNSLYPSVMMHLNAPAEFSFWRESNTLDDLRHYSQRYQLIAECAVESTDYPYPSRCDCERCWPHGRYFATLCGDELLHAVKHNHISKVYRMAAYWPVPMFESWVRDMYAARINAASQRITHKERMYKLLLNSLCGRLGMKKSGWESTQWSGYRPQWGLWTYTPEGEESPNVYRAVAGNVQIRLPESETLESMPAIEAVINANARYRMYRHRQQVGEQHVLYQGVDSLHVTEAGHLRMLELGLVGQNELGKFKPVSTHERAVYRGPMDYSLDGKHTVCGITLADDSSPTVPLEWDERDTARLMLTRDPAGHVWVSRKRRVWGHTHTDCIVGADGRTSPPILLGGELHRTLTPEIASRLASADVWCGDGPYSHDNPLLCERDA